jgi:predicted N-acetyltransferase YhbS
MISDITYRHATEADIDAIAALHADSWRRHYRGAYSDAFLDGDVFAERLAAWTRRLTPPRDNRHCTVVADDQGNVVGFAHTILGADPRWGALLDNLHVTHELKGQGIGKVHKARTAEEVLHRAPSSGLYLWVLEGNTATQAFYQARGGIEAGREESEAHGGGRIVGIRYVWPDPSVLLNR